MDTLESFVRKSREQFDQAEPAAGHFRRFEERLARESSHTITFPGSGIWLRVAAVILVLITAGLITFDLATGRILPRPHEGFATLNIPSDVREAIHYYQGLSDQRMTELDKLASGCPGGEKLLNQARQEASTFDATDRELTRALRENPGNERVQAALIQNGKMKESALSNLILQGNLETCR
jgi:hypothetical protein